MEMEAFTGKLHAYLRSVSTRIEELHTRMDKMDDRLTGEIQEQGSTLAASARNLDERLSRSCQENTNSVQQMSTLMTGVCGKLDQKFTEQIAEVDEKFTERVALHGARIVDLSGVVQQNHESFSEALGALTQRFGDKHAEQDVLVNAHYEHFNGLCAKLDSTVSEETSRLSSRVEEVSGSLSSRVDQLVDSVRRQQQHFTDVCAKLDTKFSEKNAAQDQLFDDHRREVASVAAKLDAKFSADVSALDERVQAYHKHFTDLCTHLDKTAAEQLARVDSKFTQLCAAQELALRQKDELQDQQIEEQLQRVAEQHSSLQRQCSEDNKALEERIAENCTALDKKFTAENAEQHDRIEENHKYAVDVLTKLERRLLEDTRSLDDKFTDACAKLERWATDKATEQDERMEAEHTLFIQSCSSLQSKLSTGLGDITEQVSRDMSHLDSKCADATSRADGRAEEHFSYFSGVCAGLDKKLEELVRGVDENATSRLDELDSTVRQIKTEASARSDTEHTHFAGLCSQLERGLSDGLAQLDGRLSSTIGQVERACVKRDDEIDERTENQYRQLKSLCEKLDSQCSKQIAAVAASFDSKAAQQDEAIRGIDAALSRQVQQLRDSCDGIDGRLTEELGLQAQRTDEEIARCVAEATALRNDLSEKTNFLDQKFTDKTGAQDERVDELSSTVHETKEHFTDACFRLDTRFTQEHGELRQQVEVHHAHFSTAVRDLDSKVTETSALLSERVDREFEQFAQVCAKLDERLASDLARCREQLLGDIDRLDKKSAEQDAVLHKRVDTEHKTFQSISEKLSASIADNHSHLDNKLTDAFGSLDSKYGDKCVQQEERLASEHRHFTDVCTRIEQTFNSNLDELDAAFIEACNKLDASGAENRKAIDLHYTHFTQRADQLATEMAAEAAAQTRVIEQNHRQTTDALSALEESLGRDIATLDASSLEKNAQQDERVDELSIALSEAEKTAKSDLAELSKALGATIDDTRRSLTADISALQKQVDVDVTNKINRLDEDISGRLSDLKEFVEGTVAKSIQEMTGKMDAMNTRIKKEMEPKLAETAAVADRAVGAIDTLKTRVVLEQEELKTGVAKSLEALGKDLDEMTEKVDGMTADLDINALLMGAAAAVP